MGFTYIFIGHYNLLFLVDVNILKRGFVWQAGGFELFIFTSFRFIFPLNAISKQNFLLDDKKENRFDPFTSFRYGRMTNKWELSQAARGGKLFQMGEAPAD